MENKVVEKQKSMLLESLTNQQREYLEAVDWLFNGPRGSGRTHLIVVTAFLNLLNGGFEGHIIDHHSASHEGLRSYMKSLIFGVANKIKMRVEVKETRSGFVIRRIPEPVEYMMKNE